MNNKNTQLKLEIQTNQKTHNFNVKRNKRNLFLRKKKLLKNKLKKNIKFIRPNWYISWFMWMIIIICSILIIAIPIHFIDNKNNLPLLDIIFGIFGVYIALIIIYFFVIYLKKYLPYLIKIKKFKHSYKNNLQKIK